MKNYSLSSYYFNAIAPTWIEPGRGKEDSIPSWIVLLTSAILFCASLYIMFSIWYVYTVENDKFPPFMEASDINKFYVQYLYTAT